MQTLHGCKGTIVYIDDILVFGRDKAEHDENLKEVLQRLEAKDFRLNVDKCCLEVTEAKFLGHIVSSDGIRPDDKNITALLETKEPTNMKELHAFLGLLNYYNDFLSDLAELCEPLRRLTRKDVLFKWDSQCHLSFNTLKSVAAKELKIYIFEPDAPTTVTTDASNVGIGAVLSQQQRGREVPIAFASKVLSPTERRYATNEREALACVWAAEYWEKYLLGRHFVLRTNRAALTSILEGFGSRRKAHKFARYQARLEKFDYTPSYYKGSENKVADALSRLVDTAQQNNVDCSEVTTSEKIERRVNTIRTAVMQHKMAEDPLLQQVRRYVDTTWPAKKTVLSTLLPFYQVKEELSVVDGLLMRRDRTVVPLDQQKSLLAEAHVGHPGIVRMKRKLREGFWWPGQDKDVEKHVRHCVPCQRSAKSEGAKKVPTTSLPEVTTPATHYAMDITGPFMNGQNIVVLIDYCSKFPEILSTATTTSGKIITWLKEVFARYGCPDRITTDNGPQFTSNEFTDFLDKRDVKHIRTAVYNPKGNGLVESFNRFVKYGVQAFLAENVEWNEGLRRLLAHYRATAPTPDKKSPAEIFLGHRLRLGFELRQNKHETRATQEETVQDNGDRAPVTKPSRAALRVGDLVVSRRPQYPKGASPYPEPKKVTEVVGYWTFRLDDSQLWNYRKLKKFYAQPGPQPFLEAAANDPPRPPQVRRSTRATKGRPPPRFHPDSPY